MATSGIGRAWSDSPNICPGRLRFWIPIIFLGMSDRKPRDGSTACSGTRPYRAGQPIEAVEGTEQVDLAELLPMGKDHYALRVRGTSMIGDGIAMEIWSSNIRPRRSMVRWSSPSFRIRDGRSDLKDVSRREGWRSGHSPTAFNPEMEPIFCVVEVGVVVGVVRKYPGWPRFDGMK